MREDGIVVSIENGVCGVRVRRKTACGENCASCSGACSAREHICMAKNVVGAKIGDKVVLETDSKSVLKSAFLVYILPLLAFLAFFAAVSLRFSQTLSALSGAACMLAVFAVMRLYDRRHREELLPKITEIL